MFERFTGGARQVVIVAQEQARQLGHRHIGSEHLLLGLLAEEHGVAAAVLQRSGLTLDGVRRDVVRLLGPCSDPLGDDDAAVLREIGIDLDAVRARVEEAFWPGALDQRPGSGRRRGLWDRRGEGTARSGHIPFTPRAKKALELSLREALRLKHRHIGTEHLLLGLLREGAGLAAQVLVGSGVALPELRQRVIEALDRAA